VSLRQPAGSGSVPLFMSTHILDATEQAYLNQFLCDFIQSDSTANEKKLPTCDDKKKLLTSEEKKANHINSEQRRRNAIKQGFKKLANIVPALNNKEHHSNSVILEQTELYIKQLHNIISMQNEMLKFGQQTVFNRKF
jgi:hypothetical protein